jgi:hypothetical protein
MRSALGDEPLQVSLMTGPLGFHDLRGGVGRGPDVADLAGPHQVGESAEGLLDVGFRTGSVYLVEVDVVGVQPAQGGLDLADDPPAGAAPVVRVLTHRHEELGGQDDVVAPASKRLADDLLGRAAE